MKTRWFYKNTTAFKGLLFVFALLIIIAQIWYTQVIVTSLKNDQREIVKLNAKLISAIAQNEDINVTFFFEEIIQQISFPIIITDSENTLIDHLNLGIVDRAPYAPDTEKKLKELLTVMDSENDPINIMFENTVLQVLHFGDSSIIGMLNWLPAVEGGLIGIFILAALFGFNSIKKSEQGYIWVGMAKETAHQLGTPISSLYGWLELISLSEPSDNIKNIINDMNKDVEKLNKVAQRFSQIGSNAELAEHNISDILEESVNYFKKRLPQLGSIVTMEANLVKDVKCMLNKDLFEWAIENMIKNSIDAIENKSGKITVDLKIDADDENNICIDITDTGKGITKKQQKDIFKPGFSTKKRGWGLGLNFSKRIVEEFHNGKLELKESIIDKGTSMRISLKKI